MYYINEISFVAYKLNQILYVAYKHVLNVLQELDPDTLPFKEHIVELNKEIDIPEYLKIRQPTYKFETDDTVCEKTVILIIYDFMFYCNVYVRLRYAIYSLILVEYGQQSKTYFLLYILLNMMH